MRTIIMALLVALAGCSAKQSDSNRAGPISAGDVETVTIILSNFSFDPDHIRVKVGKPVRLHLVNQSNGGHNFSSPALFAASSFPPGSSAPVEDTVEVASHQTADFTLIPRQPGIYAFKCTHTLHDLFGMTGGIEVTP